MNKQTLITRINDFLCSGGLFNPDHMYPPEEITRLMLDIRDYLHRESHQVALSGCSVCGFNDWFGDCPSRLGSRLGSAYYYDDNATIDYKPQRLEGIGWANCGVGDTSTGGKYACQDIDRMKRANPQYSYRVVERRNGKIVGTIYSC